VNPAWFDSMLPLMIVAFSAWKSTPAGWDGGLGDAGFAAGGGVAGRGLEATGGVVVVVLVSGGCAGGRTDTEDAGGLGTASSDSCPSGTTIFGAATGSGSLVSSIATRTTAAHAAIPIKAHQSLGLTRLPPRFLRKE
jgi:hypothetical protein